MEDTQPADQPSVTYKVSYVVESGGHPGAILNTSQRPEPGDRVTLGQGEFEVIEVLELLPPRGGFQFLHASCRPAPPA